MMDSTRIAMTVGWFCFLVLCFQHQGVLSRNESKPICPVPSFDDCVTCLHEFKAVTLLVTNGLKSPTFKLSHQIVCTYEKYLLGMMQDAATQNPSFKFSATYFNKELGFYVDAYNGVMANYSLDKSYWEILGGDMKPTPLGVSNYIPQNGETITFNLTVGSY